jgi:dTDP-4-amino-4,6-dideoxygalactose transaminase
MAVFKSQFNELSFYANKQLKSFRNGTYVTENAEEIKVLQAMSDVVQQTEKEQPKTEDAPKVKPATKPKSAPKKASGK